VHRDRGERPDGLLKHKTSRPEECAQLCYTANAHFGGYDKGLTEVGDSYYCEGFSFNNNMRECTLYHKVYPEPTASGKTCYVSKELTNLCRFPRGSWVRAKNFEIFYVADNVGSLFSTEEPMVCDGMDIWSNKNLPDLHCDGVSDPVCGMCVSELLQDGKGMGPFTCDVYQQKKVRICQFESQTLNCPLESQLAIQSAFYGREGDSFCAVPSKPDLVVDRDCGTLDNVADIVEAKCNGKKLCEIEAVDSIFGAQGCASVFKYAEVTFHCEPIGERFGAGTV